jgi:hypothetical protein
VDAVTWIDPDELTATVGGPATSTQFNSVLEDLKFLYQAPQVAVRLTSDQSVPTATDQVIEWDQQVGDSTGTMWSSGSPAAIVIPRAGFYHFSCSVLWDTSTDTAKRACFLEVNSVRRRGIQVAAVSPSEIILSGDTNLAENDVVEFVVRQNSGGVLAMKPRRTVLTMRWVAPNLGTPADEVD